MENMTEELRGCARRLIIEALEGAARRGAQGQGDMDYERVAQVLLAGLEAIIFEYAPPPAQIVEALRHGNQRPGGEFVYDMDQARP